MMRGVSCASSLTLFTGCLKGIIPHLPELVHYLIGCLSNSRVRGRATPHRTCTALLRSRKLLRKKCLSYFILLPLSCVLSLCPLYPASPSHFPLSPTSHCHLLSLSDHFLPSPALYFAPFHPSLSSSPPSSLRHLFAPSHAGHSAALPSG